MLDFLVEIVSAYSAMISLPFLCLQSLVVHWVLWCEGFAWFLKLQAVMCFVQ